MGLDHNAVRFLAEAWSGGACFRRVVTIGRQGLGENQGLTDDALRRCGAEPQARGDGYAEPMFRALGAVKIDSIDVSDFEGASVVHDLNNVVESDMWGEYDAVVDGGTLEHVFNFPEALRSMMRMTRLGGHIFIHAPANNQCGHGFYQFSPELFYRALSPASGFEVQRMVLHRVGPFARWYDVADPDALRQRVELMSLAPMMLLVQARRVEPRSAFKSWPQQSDYSARWQAGQVAPPAPRRFFPRAAALLSAARTSMEFARRMSVFNRKQFTVVKRRNKS